MSLEEKDKKIDEIYRLVKENHEAIEKMRKAQKWGRIFRAIYWIIVLGIGIGAYVWLEPYLKGIIETYQSALDTFGSFR